MSYLADIPPEINWSRLYDPPETLELGEGGGGGRIAFVIPWGYRYEFYDLVAGKDEVFELSGGGEITRNVPLRHPDRPEKFFAVGMTMEGWGGYEGVTDALGHDVMYSHGRATVDFGTMPWTQFEDQPFAQFSIQHASDYITKPGSAFIFPDNSKSEQDSGIDIGTSLIRLTTYLNPTLNHVLLQSKVRRINLTPIFGHPAGHVKFLGATTESPVSRLGTVTHTKSMTFLYRELHWNMQMRKDGKFDTPINTFTGGYVHQFAELNDLLV